MDKYNHWIGQLFGKLFGNKDEAYAVTLFAKTYYSCGLDQVSPQWRRHENCHQSQQKSDGMFSFALVYVWQWITRGFNHDKIDYEIEAMQAEVI